ncbi:MAG: undecaprenyl-diphosphate phosphatase [Candidatus Hydrothermales bacterium]
MKEIILGLFQGLTEFLPISSSGHLVLLQEILGFNIKGIGIETLLHLATFFSVIFYFRNRLIAYYYKNFFKIIVGILPAGIFALFFREKIEYFFEDADFLFIFFFLNGFYLLLSFLKEGNKVLDIKKALIIGFFQIFALLPGISRSGITITTGLLLKVSSRESFEFSFYMYLPLVLGAFLIEIDDLKNLEVLPSIFSFIFAFLSGLLALYILEGSLKKKYFPFFGIYTILLSIFCFFNLNK